MKHVVLLKSRFSEHGGLEKYAFRIAQAFLQKGDKVTILSTGTPPNSTIPVECTKTIAWPAFIRMEQFDHFVRKWLQKNPADLIFGMDRNKHQTHIRAGNGVHASYLKSRFLTEGRTKSLLCKINPLHRKILSLEKAAFENPLLQKLFTNSHMVRDQVLSYYNTDPSKIQVVHNGVEWHEMQTDFDTWQEMKIEAMKKFNLQPHRFQFLFIGNGYIRKGLTPLLKAFALLNRDDVELSVIGKDNHLPYYQMLARKLNIESQVHFFGPSREIRLFYQLTDSLVIPSFYDPFANVTIEALAMGLFVVSSKQNGGHEIITNQNGTIIDDLFSIDSMKESLEMALQHKKTESSATSIRTSVKHLDFSNQLKTLVDSCG